MSCSSVVDELHCTCILNTVNLVPVTVVKAILPGQLCPWGKVQ